MSFDRRHLFALAAMLVGLIGLLWIDARNDTLRAFVVDQTLVWWFVWFAGFAVAIWANEKVAVDTRLVWGVAIVARVALLFTEPTLSDDVYRYLWEGHLVTEGVSPHAFTIDDPAGDAFTIAARDLANNRSLGSPYLPAAHAIFGLLTFIGPSEPITMQIAMVVFDLVAIAGLAKLLGLVGLPSRRLLLYAWNPLVIVEVAHGAHLDAIIVAFSVWGIVATLRAGQVNANVAVVLAAPLLIAVATLTRPITLVLMPVLFWRWNWVQRGVAAVAIAVPVGLAGLASGFGLGDDAGGAGVFGSAQAYTRTFRFNSAIYQRFERFVGSQGLDDRGWNEPVNLTRLIVFGVAALAFLAVFVWARRVVNDRQWVRLLIVPIVIYVALTPVLHPWYLLTGLLLVPLLAPGPDEDVRRWLGVITWLVGAALVTLSYLTYQDPDFFAERAWVTRAVWYPIGVLAAITAAAQLLASRNRLV